jgi:lipid II:glycine glycyltransferase (peptidoglycan interpeptide bridge formation enzyme)
MEIKNINKEELNKFLDQNDYLSFLQDFEYGEIEENLGNEVLRLGIFENELMGVCQLIGYSGKIKKGLVCHHGPVVKENLSKEETLKAILKYLKENNYHKKYYFLRINPIWKEAEGIDFKNLGFRLAPTYAVSENFWVKKIQDDEEMLKEMNSTHRKLTLESLKKPYLEIEKTNDFDKFNIFLEIYKDLAKRKNFIPYSENFLKKEFEVFSKENKALLFLGRVENKYYSAALIIFSHQIAFYHHSASYLIKEPLNYKMQWEIIQEAKKRNCKFYNLWGVARKETKNHPWYGLTQFKKGFGGELIKLQPTIDYVFNWKYYLNFIYEKVKRGKL